MNDLTEKINKIKVNKQLVEIQHFCNPKTFTVGYISQFDETTIIVKTIDPNGKINGIIIIERKNIVTISENSSYLTAIKIKEQLAKKQGYYDIWQIQEKMQNLVQHVSQPIMAAILVKALVNKIVLTIGWTDENQQDTEVTGYLDAVTDDEVRLIYTDEHDLESLWIVPIRRMKINFIRLYSFQTYEYQQILRTVFNEKF